MLFNLIIGILAGIGSRYAEGPIGAFIKDKEDLPEADLRVLAFVLVLLAASFLIWIAGVDGRPIWLLIGGGLGIFGTVVMKIGKAQKEALKSKMDARNAGTGTPMEEVEPEPAPKPAPAKKKPAARKSAKKS